MAKRTLPSRVSSSSRPGREPARGPRVPAAAAATGRQARADERRLLATLSMVDGWWEGLVRSTPAPASGGSVAPVRWGRSIRGQEGRRRRPRVAGEEGSERRGGFFFFGLFGTSHYNFPKLEKRHYYSRILKFAIAILDFL
jgi:hypothetical protein